MKPIRLSRHAREESELRNVPIDLIEAVLARPEQVVPERGGLAAYQSRVDFGGTFYLVRVIVEERLDVIVVVTVYRTRKIEKYWRPT